MSEYFDSWTTITCDCKYEWTVLSPYEPPFKLEVVCPSCGKEEILEIT